jgi:hypothetical protein
VSTMHGRQPIPADEVSPHLLKESVVVEEMV